MQRAGWWEVLPHHSALIPHPSRDCVAHGRGAAPVPVTFSLLAQSESHQRERAPRFAAENRDRPEVWVCPGFSVPCATRPARRFAQLAHRRRYCKCIRREFSAIQRVYSKLAQNGKPGSDHGIAASFAPRIEHAASQIQFSSDFPLLFMLAE